MAVELLVGTYAEAGGPGLVPLRAGGDGWVLGQPRAEIRNASFGIRSTRHQLWYFVDEQGGTIGAFSDENWRQLARVDAGGEAPCHLALNAAEQHLAVSNYASGSVALFRLDEHGLPTHPPALHQHQGSGPNAERQDGPHAHWVGFSDDGRQLHCVDLGADRVLAYEISTNGRLASPTVAYEAPPGSGPRHLAFHPAAPLACLVSELASTLTVLRREPDGRLTARQILSTLPGGGEPGNLGGAIAISRAGDRLYVSIRGHDSIAVFAIAANERLSLLQHMPSGGASPRFILLLEDRRELAVAHEKGGGVAVFALEPDGTLCPRPTIIDIPGAAFIGIAPGLGTSA